MLEILAKHTQKIMQHALFIGFGLDNARQICLMLVIQCRSYQHWCLRPQTLPTASILSVLLGCRAHFKHSAAPKSQHHEHHGACFGPYFLLDTTHMRLPKTLGMLRWQKVRKQRPNCGDDAGLKKTCPEPSVAWGETSKTQPKIILILDPQKHGSRVSD